MLSLPSFAYAIALILLAWLLVGVALLGIGRAVSSLWRDRDVADDHALFWIGLGIIVAFLQLWNLFGPIGAAPLVVVLVVGLPLEVGSLLRERSRLRSLHSRRNGWRKPVLLFACVALWLADRALAPANASDSGLYHLPAIRLANDFAIVPGVGNLMPAFAVGSGAFLFNAMLNVGPLDGRAWHVANALLLLAFVLRIWTPTARVLRGERRPADAFDAALVPLCLFLLLGKDVSSPKTDLPAGLLLLVMASQLARVLCDPSIVGSLRAHVCTAAVLGGTAVCVKLSAAPFAALLWFGFVATWLARERPARSVLLKPAVVLLAILVLLPGVFFARNVITSGYPLFPATVLPMNVEWRLERAAVDKYHRGFAEFTRFDLAQGLAKKVTNSPLRFYGRLMDPGFSRLEDATATNWLRGWFFTALAVWPIEVFVPLIVAAAFWWRGRGGDRAARRARDVIAGAAAVALVVWFLTVPDGRYIWFATWAIAGAAAIPALAGLSRRAVVAGLVATCVVVVAFRVVLQLVYRADGSVAQVFVIAPGPDRGFHPPPRTQMRLWRSRHGATLWTPADPIVSTVWHAPQPATSARFLDPDLRLRRDGNFQSGVIIDRVALSPSPP